MARTSLFLAPLLVAVCVASPARANPTLADYPTDEALAARLQKLAAAPAVRLSSLGKTAAGRDIPLLTLGSGENVDSRPAMLIVAHVQPAHFFSGEVALQLAEKLIAQAETDADLKLLLATRTIYLLPRPSPDAAAKAFAKPFREPQGNARRTDDDRDGTPGEDPPDDLNGDGWITAMRISDVAGDWIAHPADPRVLIKADPAKQERGQFRLFVEGRDNDGDELYNEDAGDGVSFNRNFTYNYPQFKAHAGPNQVSEAETRAVADFCFDHPNIALVWTLTPDDNLLTPWKPDPGKDKTRIRTTLLVDDARYQDVLASNYQKLVDPKGVPVAPDGEGSFTHFAYFHYGRWSLGSRLWWIPPTDAPAPPEGEKKQEDKRGADEINALRYFDANKIDAFVAWTALDHPDFPGKKVEVGGFKPFYRLNPPLAAAEPLAGKQLEYLKQLAARQPRLSLADAKAETLGGGVVRLTITVVNEGFLPTAPEMGDVNRHAYPLQIAWTVPEKSEWLQGSPRQRLPRLAGSGGNVTRTWLVRMPEPVPKEITVKAWSPTVDPITATIRLP